MVQSALHYRSEAFVSDQVEDMAIIDLRRDLMEVTTDLEAKESLFGLMHRVDQAPGVRALVLVGNEQTMGASGYGAFLDRLFSTASAPATGTARSELEREQLLSREEYGLCQLVMRLHRSSKITVAALDGEIGPPYLGLALACDYRLVSQDTVFQLSSSRFGVPPTGGLGFFLPLYVGQGRAMELVLHGEPLAAARARTLGLVNHVLPTADFVAACCQHLQENLDMPLEIAGATRSLLVPYTESELAQHLERECDVVRSTWRRHELHQHPAAPA